MMSQKNNFLSSKARVKKFLVFQAGLFPRWYFLAALAFITGAASLYGHEGGPGTVESRSPRAYHFILSGGVGYGINIDNAVQNYTETKFAPGFSTFLSLRLGCVLDKKARLCLELSYFHKSMMLREMNDEFGTVDLSWFLATPGVQWMPAKSSPIFYVAIVGFGYGTHRFTANRSWPFLDVQINDKWVFMLLPFKVDWLLHKNIAVGVSFSGGSGVIAKVNWKNYGISYPDVEEFLFSPAQIQIHASLLF